jgi:hypothetical protein
MTLIYALIGLAVVYAAYVFGTRKNSNQTRMKDDMNQSMPGDTNVHGPSENTHKKHRGHGCC